MNKNLLAISKASRLWLIVLIFREKTRQTHRFAKLKKEFRHISISHKTKYIHGIINSSRDLKNSIKEKS